MKRRTLILTAVLCAAAAGAVWIFLRPARPPTDRVRTARANQLGHARKLFTKAGLRWPPEAIYLRAFKEEAELELWAREPRSAKYRLVHRFPVLGSSGGPGPKRVEGDGQVPEGFYVVDRFNPASLFHLSLGLNYPNASDRVRSDPERPGFDIFIHGGRATIGCLPIGDDGIELLYIIALEAKERRIPVHLFPSRRENGTWIAPVESAAALRPELAAFWKELAPALDTFDAERSLPVVTTSEDGTYVVK